MEIRLEKHLAAVHLPANLRINDQIRRFREICRRNGCLRPYHHFAFGQSPFPPPPAVVEALRRLSAAQKILIFNHPNNPTGVTYTRSELDALAEVCRRHGVIVISDEIYALTAFNAGGFASMGAAYPEGTVVTGGLSKDRSCGGWRLGVGILPQGSDAHMENLLQVEHAAILPAEALLLPSGEFAARCSFVDYDGTAALERWREAPPDSPEEEAAFVRANCPLVTDGVAVVDRYLGQLRRGERPRHYGGVR